MFSNILMHTFRNIQIYTDGCLIIKHALWRFFFVVVCLFFLLFPLFLFGVCAVNVIITYKTNTTQLFFLLTGMSGWPSGLRRQTQAKASSVAEGWVFWSTVVGVGSNPTSDRIFFFLTFCSFPLYL